MARFKHWGMVICPLATGRPTKTKVFDDGIAFNSVSRPQIGVLVQWFVSKFRAEGGDSVFSFTQQQLNKAIAQASAALGVAKFEWTAYHARRGGPSEDAAAATRSMDEIQKRGRWVALKSLRRYEQQNRLHVVLRSLPKPLLDHCSLCCRDLVSLVISPKALIPPSFSAPVTVPPVAPDGSASPATLAQRKEA